MRMLITIDPRFIKAGGSRPSGDTRSRGGKTSVNRFRGHNGGLTGSILAMMIMTRIADTMSRIMVEPGGLDITACGGDGEGATGRRAARTGGGGICPCRRHKASRVAVAMRDGASGPRGRHSGVAVAATPTRAL